MRPSRWPAGRYQITAGVRESARGNVFRAIDRHDGATVIVKQARALVSQDVDQVDTRLRLRNERRICLVLDGVPGVPVFIDHFRHGDDEFLVTSDRGDRTLAEDVVRRGPYGPGLARLAGQLARIVCDTHDRGVIIRDLAPTNVVLRGDEASVVDFGLAGYDGLHLGGGTPGYSPARQLRDEPPEPDDDLYALGMTLLFAATRLHPVTLGDDENLPLTRALQTISARYGPSPGGVIAAVVRLLDGGESARNALRDLAAGRAAGPVGRPLPAVPPIRLTPELVPQIRDSLRSDLVTAATRILRATDDSHEAHDGSLYTGSAGIGLELLNHAGHPGVTECLTGLVSFTERTVRRVRLPAGLYTGRTGADLFVARARKLGIDTPAQWDPEVPPEDFRPEGDDLIVGAAGIGLGQLLLFRANGDRRHLDAAGRCVSRLLSQATPESSFGRNPEPENATEPAAGRAHGLAGTTELLISFTGQTRDPSARTAAQAGSRRLADHASDLIRRSRGAQASPLAASWCQGLAGIGETLLHASTVIPDPAFLDLARQSAEACLALLPRMSALGQCCGAAGIGNFLLDLAIVDEQDRYLAAACEVADHLLRRSAGPPERPVFTETGPDSFAASWATGVTGILTYFRRLAAQLERAPSRLAQPELAQAQPAQC